MQLNELSDDKVHKTNMQDGKQIDEMNFAQPFDIFTVSSPTTTSSADDTKDEWSNRWTKTKETDVDIQLDNSISTRCCTSTTMASNGHTLCSAQCYFCLFIKWIENVHFKKK